MTTSKFSLSAAYPANWPTVSTTAAIGMSGAAAVAVVATVALPLVRYLRGPAVPVHERGAILVTGASSGIGRDAAVTLSREEGITVLATVLNASEARQMKQENPQLVPLALDVRSQDSVDNCMDLVTAELRNHDMKLIGLVNNAGIGGGGGCIEMLDIDQAKNVFDVNTFGVLRMLKACAPLLRTSGPGSRIINTSSVNGLLSLPGKSVYCGSKHAVEAISDASRLELHQFGIWVSTLNPGYINTEIANTAAKQLSNSIVEWSPELLEAYGNPKAISAWSRIATSKGSPPALTSAAIKHAMRSPRPRRRYVVGGIGGGQTAWSVLCNKWFLPTAMMDARILQFVRQVREEIDISAGGSLDDKAEGRSDEKGTAGKPSRSEE